MGCFDWIVLVWQVVTEMLITFCLISWESIRWLVPRRQKSIEGQVVLVTGAGHGIGKNIALHMGKLQATVVCWDKDETSNSSTAQEINHLGGRAVAYTVDVSEREQVMEAARQTEKVVGHVAMLINNVGVYPVKQILDWSHADLSELVQVNFFSHFWTLQAFLPGMISRNNGHVVAISSAAAIAPVASEVPYSASKAAVTALMDGMQQEAYFDSKCKIKFTTVHPYYTATRNDLPVKFEIRFDRLSPGYVSAEIVKGILQEREMVSVPRFMLFWIYFMRCLPQKARHRWREVSTSVCTREMTSTKKLLVEQLGSTRGSS
ncbi:17-beta-hydroxysteroid dehydrogenase 13-like isoform X2 [Bacillus rossius redtenbacheri]|uniref:17-beta-hydroxysteroid dehydrogenase 13-like isoform X2 n=1 Tax=Bacillus rossius redtenbacheri TaxID=93214 RepID=UPI002FDCBAA2